MRVWLSVSARNKVLDIVQSLLAEKFIRRLRWFIGRQGCFDKMICDNVKKSVSQDSQNFKINLNVN